MNADLLAANLTAHWIQSGLLAIVSLLAFAVLRVNEPRLRLVCLQVVLAIALLLPWMQPRQPIQADVRATQPLSAPLAPEGAGATGTTDLVGLGAAETKLARSIEPLRAILAVALAGLALRLLWLASGLVRLARFKRKARQVSPPPVAEDMETRLGVSPRYVEHTRPGSPSTFGFLRAIVALPAGFDSLEPSFQRAIICHELVHVKRRDAAIAFAEELAAAVLWFHPWIWLLRSRIRVAREQVVDRKVVTLLDNRAEYARCLVEMSGHDLAPHLSYVGAAMLRERELRARIDAMFQEVSMSRLRMSAAVCVLVAVMGATGVLAMRVAPLHAAEIRPLPVGSGFSRTLTNPPDFARRSMRSLSAVALAEVDDLRASSGKPEGGSHEDVFTARPTAAMQMTSQKRPRLTIKAARKTSVATAAAQQVVATDTPRRQTKLGFAEYPQDALAKGIKGLVTVAINVSASGDVTSASIVSGPQELRASASKAAMGLKFEPGRSTTAMTIDVEYLLDRQSWGVRIVDRASPAASTRMSTPDFLNQQAAAAAQPDPAGVYRVGGPIRPPRKSRNVEPVYPEAAKAARVQGVVILEVTIDENGNVRDTRVLRSIPLLDQAAVDAVKQWQFERTFVSGFTVPVIMTVTVNFQLWPDQVRLRITFPNGIAREIPVGAKGDISQISDLPQIWSADPGTGGIGRLGFVVVPAEGSMTRATVAIYDMTRAVPGETPPLRLGNVEVTVGGGVVQSPTTPSFGIELLSITRR